MAKKARRSGFRGGFLGFGKKHTQPAGGAKPAHVIDKRVRNEHFRFLMKQISNQSKYVPGLANVHNKLLSRPLFYEKKLKQSRSAGVNIPVITRVFSEDARLALNSWKMRLLEEKINDTRLDGVRAFGKNGFAAAKGYLDKAKELEAKFNDLKEQNLLIFTKHFGKNNE